MRRIPGCLATPTSTRLEATARLQPRPPPPLLTVAAAPHALSAWNPPRTPSWKTPPCPLSTSPSSRLLSMEATTSTTTTTPCTRSSRMVTLTSTQSGAMRTGAFWISPWGTPWESEPSRQSGSQLLSSTAAGIYEPSGGLINGGSFYGEVKATTDQPLASAAWSGAPPYSKEISVWYIISIVVHSCTWF